MRFGYLFIGIILTGLLFTLGAQEIQVYTEEWTPFNYSENGQIVGISTEIVKATLERAGYSANISILPWNRAYEMVQQERNSLIYTIYRSKEREDKFIWIGPIDVTSNIHFIKLAERDDILLSEVNDGKKYMVGVLQNNFSHQKLLEEGYVEGENLHVSRTTETNIRMLLAGRVDLIPGNEANIHLKMKQMGYDPQLITRSLRLYESQSRPYMALNRDSSEQLAEDLQTALDEILKGNLLEEIKRKYHYETD